MNQKPNDPNKGMDTGRYMWAVLAALVLMIISALVVVGTGKTKVVPNAVQEKPTKAASPQ